MIGIARAMVSMYIFWSHRTYLVGRTVPDKLYDSDPPPTVVMKIDIDGQVDIIHSSTAECCVISMC